MRTALALATALAGSVLGVAGLAAPAHAEACPPPHFAGFTASLDVHGISCERGAELAYHVGQHGTPHGWSCTKQQHGTVSIAVHCRSTEHAGHRFALRLVHTHRPATASSPIG
jgi:hypothetical protein